MTRAGALRGGSLGNARDQIPSSAAHVGLGERANPERPRVGNGRGGHATNGGRLLRVRDALRCKGGLEGKGSGGGAVLFEVGESRQTVFDRRNVTGWDPPEGDGGTGETLEPFLAATEHLGVRALVGVGAEMLDRLPDGHVEENAVVLEGPGVGGGAAAVLEPPDETGAGLRQRVQLREARHEAGQGGTVKRRHRPGDVHLREVMSRHRRDAVISRSPRDAPSRRPP